jgi:hypothetical protein
MEFDCVLCWSLCWKKILIFKGANMAEKSKMQQAEMNTSHTGSLTGWGLVENLKRGLRRARRRLSKKIIETELNNKLPKAHHR